MISETEAPVGTLLKFKVQDFDNSFANEKDVFTTVSGEWATYHWDFAGDPPVYDIITLMLGYDVLNDASADATFFFDDIQQTAGTTGLNEDSPLVGVHSFPNPASEMWTISSENESITAVTLFDMHGKEVFQVQPNNERASIDVSSFPSGVYVAIVSTPFGTGALKVLVK